jgi:hypothetical protein
MSSDVHRPVGVSVNRQGWRPRIAHVEVLLRGVEESWPFTDSGVADWDRVRTDLREALAEVRSLLDGEPS